MTETMTAEQINEATDKSIAARTEQIVTDAKADAERTAKRPAPKKPAAKKAPAKATAKTAPAPKPTPKADKNSAKQELCRIALEAMATAVIRANGLKKTGYLAAIDPDEALQILSQMTHHFPAGRDASGNRWWPASLPKPDRSDWR
jgi:hypothetical protein